MPREKMVCQATVLEMGWTKNMIARLLPEPTLRPNPYGAQKSAPMRLWKEADVLACMASEEYKALHAQAEKRRRLPGAKGKCRALLSPTSRGYCGQSRRSSAHCR